MGDIRKLIRIQILVIILFIFLKWSRRSIVEQGVPEFIEITLYSLPNFWEAIAGTITLTAIGLVANHKLLLPAKRLQEYSIYLLSIIIGGVFVITQELKIHNLGGDNIYDPYDLGFSITGLIFSYLLFIKLKPSIKPD